MQQWILVCFFAQVFRFVSWANGSNTTRTRHQRAHIMTSKVPGGELKCWSDSLADDYIHRPLQKEIEDICFYVMTSQYKKMYKSYKPKSIRTYEFSASHPGYKFSHLSKLKHSTIPRIALPQNKHVPWKNLSYNKPIQQKNHMINKKCMQKWLFWCSTLIKRWTIWQMMEVTWKKFKRIAMPSSQKIHKILGKGFWNTSKYRRQGNLTKTSNVLKTQFQWQLNKKAR